MSRRTALIVPVQDYADSAIQSLQCVDNDGHELAAFLRYRAGFDEVKLLRPRDDREVLDSAADLCNRLSSGDLFLFYFGGHGVDHEGRHLLLCPQARPRRLKYLQDAVPVDLLKEETGSCGATRVFIFDACRSPLLRDREAGEGEGLKDERALRDLVQGASQASGPLAVLCACGKGSTAAELPRVKHGLFTAALLESLEDAVQAHREVVLGDGLADDLAGRMVRLAREHGLGVKQKPWLDREAGTRAVLVPGLQVSATQEIPVPPADVAPSRRTGRLEVIEPAKLLITSEPSGASVEIDGRSAGVTPLAAELKAGTYSVKVTLEGYQAWERRLRFNGEGDADLSATLQRRLWRPGELLAPSSLGMKFAYIPTGQFMMGSPASEEGHDDGELQHRVRISKPFGMGIHQVTRGQFAAFASAAGYQTEAEKEGWSYAWKGKEWAKVNGVCWRKPGFDQDDNHPVVCVSWNDAQEFMQWLSQQDDRLYHLPTEAQWEYACRAGTQTTYPWGDSPDAAKGWANCADITAKAKFPNWTTFNWADGFVYTSPVGSFRSSTWGLYDMIGNVLEWCEDRYGEYPKTEVTDPAGPADGLSRVLRGGSWRGGPLGCRAACRSRSAPDYRCRYIGFRLALDFQ